MQPFRSEGGPHPQGRGCAKTWKKYQLLHASYFSRAQAFANGSSLNPTSGTAICGGIKGVLTRPVL